MNSHRINKFFGRYAAFLLKWRWAAIAYRVEDANTKERGGTYDYTCKTHFFAVAISQCLASFFWILMPLKPAFDKWSLISSGL